VFVYRGTFSKTNGTIYGYSASDTVNSNTVKNSSGTIVNDWGHAAVASVSASSFKRKEAAAGPSANLSWNYNNGSPVFSGEWEPDSPGTEGNPFPLTVNTWANDSIASTASGSALWYSFSVTSGTTYYIWWNDSDAGNNTKTLDVKVSAYYSNGTSIFTGIDSGWTSARSFTAGSGGTVKIKVEPFSSGSTGTFAVAYSAGNTRPGGNIPGIPTGVTATTESSSSITVSWSSVSEAVGYYVYRSTSASGTYSSLGSSSSTSYSDTGLSANTAYYYKVSAYNSYGEGSQSSYASRTTAPDTPTGVTATASSFNITVSWSSVSGATSYYLYRSTSASGTYTRVATPSTTSYTNTGLSAGTTYYYKVSAYNGSGESAESSYTSATTSATAPGTPTGVTATATSPNTITVNWSSVPGATGYYIYYSTSASGTYNSLSGSFSSTVGYITECSANTTYYFKVSAYNSYGESTQSAYVSVRTLATIALSASTWTNGSVTQSSKVAWYSFSVTSGTRYYVWWNDSYEGNNTKTGDVWVSAYYSNGTSIFTYEDSGWSSPRSFIASSTGTVTIKVEPYGDYGTFAVAYRAGNSTRP
jgi:fibronectin type 3 domain-containing protein